MGLFSSDRYNRGRSWHLDRKKYNTQEDWEKPMNRRKRKYFDGGRAIELDYDKQMALSNLDMIHDYAVELDKMVSEDAELEEWVKMKMTRIEQNVADVKHALEAIDKYGQGGMIFKKQLLHVAKYATEIKNMVEGGVGLMSWQEEKLAISAEYIDGLYHHLDYKMGNRASQFGWGGQAKYDEGGDVFKEALWATLQDTAYSIDSVGNDEYVIYLQQDATIDEVSERLKAIGDFTVGDYVMSHPIEIIGVDADLSTDNRIAMRVKNTTNEYAGGGGVDRAIHLQMSNLDKSSAEKNAKIFEEYNNVVEIKEQDNGLYSIYTSSISGDKYAGGGGVKSHYNTGRSWHSDRAKFNKSEDWEIPMNQRKGKKSKSSRSGYTKADKKRGYTYIPNMMIREADVENRGKITNIDGANILDGIYVKAGTKYAEGGMIQALRAFNIDDLDQYERFMYDRMIRSLSKEDALQIIINDTEGDFTQLSPKLADIASEYYKGGGRVKNYKYVPNYMIDSVTVERNGKETEIDGDRILDGLYVKGKVKYAGGGSFESEPLAHYQVGDAVFIDYMDAADYCDENNIDYSEIMKTHEYAEGGGLGKDKVFKVVQPNHTATGGMFTFISYDENNNIRAKAFPNAKGNNPIITLRNIKADGIEVVSSSEITKLAKRRVIGNIANRMSGMQYMAEGGGVGDDIEYTYKIESAVYIQNQGKNDEKRITFWGGNVFINGKSVVFIPYGYDTEEEAETRAKKIIEELKDGTFKGFNLLDEKYLNKYFNRNLPYANGGGVDNYERGGVSGDIYSIENPEHFKQVLSLYNTLYDYFGFDRYYVDNVASLVVFMRSKPISEDERDAITSELYDLDEQGYDVFDTSNISFIKSDGEVRVGLKDIVKFANGGGVRVSNRDARYYVANKTRFTANNLDGVFMNGVYVVRSYGYYPIFIYHEGKWYENSDKFSPSTGKQMGQTRPDATIKISKDEMKYLMNNGSLLRPVFTEFDYGGSTMTDESVIHENCVNGEIHCDTLTEIIGHEPNYPYQQVGMMKLEKCFLRPYYRIC